MVLVTPRLVRALDPDEVPTLPVRPGAFISPSDEENQAVPGTEESDRPGLLDAPPPPTRKPPTPPGAVPPRPPGDSPSPDGDAPSIRAVNARTGGRRARRARRGAGPRRDRHLGLSAFSSFVIDYGVLWTARRQAQNAADAGAMAAAAYLGFTGGDEASARARAALEAARPTSSGASCPRSLPADVTFSPCPVGAPAPAAALCVRVDVFRNQERGNPLPTIFSEPGRRRPARACAPPRPPRWCSPIPRRA